MRNERVTRFNYIAGNAPASTKEDVLKQIAMQCVFLLEEVKETQEAALNNDILEVVDGIADVNFVAAYLQTLIESLGVDRRGAFNAVCDNNDEKWTTSFELAEKWLSQQTIPCYIQTTIYNNQTYYTVRKKDGDKVVKYQNFPKVDLTPFIPKDLIDAH